LRDSLKYFTARTATTGDNGQWYVARKFTESELVAGCCDWCLYVNWASVLGYVREGCSSLCPWECTVYNITFGRK